MKLVNHTINPPQRSGKYCRDSGGPESASSSIIGVILLIMIVIIIAGSVSLILFSQPLPDKVPIAFLSVSQSKERVELFNKAGDSLTRDSISILVDDIDRTDDFKMQDNSQDWKTLDAGERLYLKSPIQPESVRIIYTGNSGQYLLASSESGIHTPTTIIPTLTPPPTPRPVMDPAVLQISPDSGYNDTSINRVNVTGTGFLKGASVTLNSTGCADVPATDIVVVSPVEISCSFNLTGVPAGFRNVVVTSVNGNEGMLGGGFRVDPAGERPLADFVANPANGTAPLTVQFNDTSRGSPHSWIWTFGDGGTSTVQNASHQYTNPGSYTVNLTVTNAEGSYRKIKTQYINVTSRNKVASQNPCANFTSNVTQIPVNGFVQFYDNSTNTPTRWQWVFGDELFYDTHQNPVHQYINPGVFSVRLTVTNADGSDSEIKTDYIQVVKVNHAPVLTPIIDKTATVGTPLTFTIAAIDPDNDSLRYSATGLPSGAAFDPATKSFTWTPLDSMIGNYSVTFIVSDGVLTDSKKGRITITSKPGIPPTAQFTANTLQGKAPLTVQFTDQSVSAGRATYTWDINNDGIAEYSTQNPVHSYQSAGIYTVRLTVTNKDGTDSEIKTNYIQVSAPDTSLSSILYLDQYGIKGDGTDETTKLQSAINYAHNNGYKYVTFPKNKVIGLQSSSIRFLDGIIYNGNGCTLKRLNRVDSDVFLRFGAASGGSGLEAFGFIIDSNSQDIYSAGDGVYLNSNVYFHDNEVKNCREYSVSCYGAKNVRITNNVIHDGRQYGIATGGGDVTGVSHTIVVTGNTIYNMQEVGIKIRGTHDSVISNNKVTLPEIAGQDSEGITLYSLDYGNANVEISGNTVIGNLGRGSGTGTCIESQSSANTGIKILNNRVSSCDTGIHILYSNALISGNILSGCTQFIVNSGSSNTLANNILGS